MNDAIQNAMNIILKAGDARNYCSEALKAVSVNDFDKAEELMRQSNEYIVEAHKIHTEIIQKDAAGQKNEYSLLFTHAQDTLMTIKSEIVISKKIIAIMKNNFSLLNNLEKRVGELEKRMER